MKKSLSSYIVKGIFWTKLSLRLQVWWWLPLNTLRVAVQTKYTEKQQLLNDKHYIWKQPQKCATVAAVNRKTCNFHFQFFKISSPPFFRGFVGVTWTLTVNMSTCSIAITLFYESQTKEYSTAVGANLDLLTSPFLNPIHKPKRSKSLAKWKNHIKTISDVLILQGICVCLHFQVLKPQSQTLSSWDSLPITSTTKHSTRLSGGPLIQKTHASSYWELCWQVTLGQIISCPVWKNNKNVFSIFSFSYCALFTQNIGFKSVLWRQVFVCISPQNDYGWSSSHCHP